MVKEIFFSVIFSGVVGVCGDNYCLKKNVIIHSGIGHPSCISEPKDYTNNISVDVVLKNKKVHTYKVISQWVRMPDELLDGYLKWYFNEIKFDKKNGKMKLCIEINGYNYRIHKVI